MGERLKLSLILIIGILLMGSFLVAKPQAQEDNNYFPEENFSGVLTIQNNSLIAVSILPEPKVVKRIKVIATAYSSTPRETDSDPYTTAAGTRVREGIVANNLLPFGTKIRMPELYGEKIFVVEDRMSKKKGYYHIDIWFPSYWEAKEFGAKNIYIEILES